ncbi:uncharacterized protein si:ch211-245h14.1 isoform X2 [Anguilla rostrata]|uniref:uncharacterized protein si:ch211-245h14.1 isoform X2 n=1 Tax=Anguilla rostrata TaxID=7938 RepID=UPI0030CE5F70
MFKQPKIKIFTTVTGDTSNAHRTFVDNVAAKVPLTEVQRWEECDVIMKFCPVSSRPGPDIDAALKDIPANKPAVLVVMHHTYDPNRSVYDSSNYVKQSDVLSVDCLFYESKGLFRCPANEEAVGKTITHIRKYSKERLPAPVLTEQGEKQVAPGNENELRFHQRGEKQVAPGNENELRFHQRTSSLREKISNISQRAAENLCAAGVSDAQIFTLTLPELTELLPGKENFQKRREIMDLIRQHFETSSLREKISNISQRAAENLRGVSDAQIFTLTLPELTELLPGMENFQKRREIMELIRQHFETSSLREKISNISQRAAENLRGVSDAQISTLTLPKLTELLPGMENFQKRREIMDLIRQHFELQVSEVLREHRHLLKEQERQLQAALETTRLRIGLLDKLAKREELPGKQPREGTKSPESVASNGEPSRSSPLNQNPRAPLADRPAVLPDENTTSSSRNYNSSPPPVSSTAVQTDKNPTSSSRNYNSSPPPVSSTAVQTDKNPTSSSRNYNSSPPPVSSTAVQTDKNPTSSSAVKVHISGDGAMCPPPQPWRENYRLQPGAVQRDSEPLSGHHSDGKRNTGFTLPSLFKR